MTTKLTLQISILLLLLVSASQTSEEIDWTNSSMWLECDGQYQSPIDIISNEVEFCPYYIGFSLHSICMDFMYEETGQSLTAEAEEISYVSFYEYDSMSYEFAMYESAYIEYHTPSEHTINGRHYDLEMQLVHHYSQEMSMYMHNDSMKNGTNQTSAAVVSILFKEDHLIDEDAFDTFLPHGNQTEANLLQSFQCIAERFFYHYKGSLTTPPCTEPVNWFILRDPLPIRPENLQRFQSLINHGENNNRPIQDKGKREVYLLSQSMCHHEYYE